VSVFLFYLTKFGYYVMLYESNHYTGEVVLPSVYWCCGEMLCDQCQISIWNNRLTYWNLMKKKNFSLITNGKCGL